MNLFLPEEIIQYVFNEYITHDSEYLNILYNFLPDFTFNINKYISIQTKILEEETYIYRYLDNKLTCTECYDKDFKLIYESNHKNNRLHGPTFSYYRNGIINEIKNYTDGKLDGDMLKHNKDGTLLTYTKYENSTIIEKILVNFPENCDKLKYYINITFYNDFINRNTQNSKNCIYNGISYEFCSLGNIKSIEKGDKITRYNKDGTVEISGFFNRIISKIAKFFSENK